jgi:dipeptidyl aminopeptidase/acylaminoacyl peptidase
MAPTGGGQGLALYSARFDARESRPFGLAADVLAVSASGEMALSLDRHTVTSMLSEGRLARAPRAGGSAPRELLDGVVDADWSRDGQSLAISREDGTEARIEFPVGRTLFKSGGYLSSPRISPDGSAVAFINHPVRGDDRGTIAIVDTSGRARTLTEEFPSITGLAWSSGGQEIWFSVWLSDGYGVEAVTRDGRRRAILRTGSRIKLFDVMGGRALVGYEDSRAEVTALLQGNDHERDLSWLDGTVVTAISHAGDRMPFVEGWEGGGARYSFFLRRTDSSVPVRLGEGIATDISADGRQVLALAPEGPARVIIAATGAGEAKSIPLPSLDAVVNASWFPDQRRLLLANEPGQTLRAWVLEIEGARLTPITPPGLVSGIFGNGYKLLSPDGRSVVAKGADGRTMVYPVDGGPARVAPGVSDGEEPVAWAADGRGLFVRTHQIPSRVTRIDVTSGTRVLWRELMPSDPGGVFDIFSVVVTPEGQYYAYSFLRALNQLYVVDGLR